ncbi:MAG: PAS domain S-box protein [Ignavibacteria bacterium]|nr:PAS domain S-box protein [Ignavibacteria bacterium]
MKQNAMPVPKILIVEDEALIANDIWRSLDKLKFECVGIASTGLEAVQLSNKLKPDLILMDIKLKGVLDGIETAAIINRGGKIPIVYLSAHQDEEIIKKSRSTDPYGYLLKPVNERDLNSCIRMSLFRFKAENKLRESEERFKALTEAALASIIIIHGNKLLYANPYSEILSGYTPKELYEMNFWDIVHPDFAEMVKERGLARQKREIVPQHYEVKLKSKSGIFKWVKISATRIIFDGKKCTLAIVFDITERKIAEDFLSHSEEKFRAVAESTPAQIVIFQGDNFVYANPYSKVVTGYTPEELIGMNFWALVHPDSIDLARERGRARQQGKNVVDNYELKIRTKSGDEKWINYSARVIEFNLKPAVIGIATDISEKKKILEEIKESRQKYKAFIEQSTEGIYRIEALKPVPVILPPAEQVNEILDSFYTAECNDAMAKMYGYSSAEELVGKKMSEFLLPDDKDNREMIAYFVENNYRITDAESSEIDKDGNIKYFQNNAVGVIEKGLLARVWGMQKDITARKKVDQQLKENIEYSKILNYFTTSLLKQNTVEEILWDITENCFSKLSFVDCAIYLLDEKSGMLLQKAAYGRKNIRGFEILNPLHLKMGEGIIGSAAQRGEAEIVPDTSKDPRYVIDDELRLSEIAVPIHSEGKVIGVIDSEHPDKNFFKDFHLSILKSIASLCSVKIVQALHLEEIKKSEERYRTFVKQSSEGIYRLEFKEPVPVNLAIDEQIKIMIRNAYIGECNDVYANMYGMNKAEELFGKNTGELAYVNINEIERDRKFIMNNYNTIEEESIEKDLNGNTRYFMGNAVGIIENGSLVSIWGVKRDITEKKKSEETLKKSLNEKEILLKEIHHRVKNNLQIVTSLLKLQSSYVQDEKVKLLFKESQNRVKSMSLIHQKLYQTKDLANIDFKEYVQTVATHLQHSFGMLEDRVKIEIDVTNIFMSIDNAIPAGLIINELISNALKHAFADGRTGKIFISAAYDEFKMEYWLVIRDDGIGIPKNFDINEAKSFGLKLVLTLVEQMSGTLEFVSMGGSEFRINFKGADYKERN